MVANSKKFLTIMNLENKQKPLGKPNFTRSKLMSIILSMILSLTARYQEAKDPQVYLSSETVIVNDELKERITVVKEGKKPFTYHVIVVEDGKIAFEFRN
jgi:hypothetical protein